MPDYFSPRVGELMEVGVGSRTSRINSISHYSDGTGMTIELEYISWQGDFPPNALKEWEQMHFSTVMYRELRATEQSKRIEEDHLKRLENQLLSAGWERKY